jgi:hypothetical protein
MACNMALRLSEALQSILTAYWYKNITETQKPFWGFLGLSEAMRTGAADPGPVVAGDRGPGWPRGGGSWGKGARSKGQGARAKGIPDLHQGKPGIVADSR